MLITSPGKVLFFGGYSVLLRSHLAYVLAVVDEQGKGVSADVERCPSPRILSPQFNLDVNPLKDDSLVSKVYQVAYTYLSHHGFNEHACIKLENSKIFGKAEEKSGLGSSAAASVSVVKALFLANDLDVHAHVETVHKLAQWAYAWFSGKVGSGFDIATASFARSIVYTRYDPSSLHVNDLNNVVDDVSKPWPWLSVSERPLPRAYSLLFFNVLGAHTNTISAVKAWKRWRAHNKDVFEVLMEEQDKWERLAVQALFAQQDERVRHYTHKARAVHRQMQQHIRSVVKEFEDIEPPQLTRFIEAVEALDGVVAGRCPGAGGYDSVAFIVRSDFNDVDKVVSIARSMGLALQHHTLKVI